MNELDAYFEQQKLTDIEKRIAWKLVKGWETERIAKYLEMDQETFDGHLASMMCKYWDHMIATAEVCPLVSLPPTADRASHCPHHE